MIFKRNLKIYKFLIFIKKANAGFNKLFNLYFIMIN